MGVQGNGAAQQHLVLHLSPCNIILAHSHYLTCSVCDCKFHIRCLPNIHKSDKVYIENRLYKDWLCIKCCSNLFPFNDYESDVDFNKCISVLCSTENNISIVDLNDRVFNPFDLNDTDTYLNDCDPDNQYFKVAFQYNECKYYLDNTFKEIYMSDNRYKNLCLCCI